MGDLSHFESRAGTLSCTSREVFDFVTDIRNFTQFIPQNSISDWQSAQDSCSFNVPMVGAVSVRLEDKVPHNKVIFSGDALKKNDFSLVLNISESLNNSAEVKVLLEAELNPVLKMMATKPIVQFLEVLMKEMENFRGWKDIIK